MATKYKYVLTEMIRVMVGIMAASKGPYTKTMLVDYLNVVYPKLTHQELKNEISSAILTDKYCNERFDSPKPGWWDLKERVNDSTS